MTWVWGLLAWTSLLLALASTIVFIVTSIFQKHLGSKAWLAPRFMQLAVAAVIVGIFAGFIDELLKDHSVLELWGYFLCMVAASCGTGSALVASNIVKRWRGQPWRRRLCIFLIGMGLGCAALGIILVAVG